MNTKVFEKIPGWFDYSDIYDCMVRNAKDGSHFVEVGSYLGRSAFYMASAIKDSGKKIKFDAIDIWTILNHHDAHLVESLGRGDMVETFRAFMREGGVEDFVNPIKMDSVAASKLYADGSLDFVWIDADHEYDAVKADILAWKPKVKATGCLAGHDYYHAHQGVIKAVNELFIRRGELFEIHDFFVKGTSWLLK